MNFDELLQRHKDQDPEATAAYDLWDVPNVHEGNLQVDLGTQLFDPYPATADTWTSTVYTFEEANWMYEQLCKLLDTQ